MSDEGRTKMTPELLEERLVQFAVRSIPLANRLSSSFAGKHIAGQVLRSGTAAAPHYAEARSAESRLDFIHKLRIAVKELNETCVWLRIVALSGILPAALLDGLHAEGEELKRILGAAIRTARLRTHKTPSALANRL
jgi:four helix bundle protein